MCSNWDSLAGSKKFCDGKENVELDCVTNESFAVAQCLQFWAAQVFSAMPGVCCHHWFEEALGWCQPKTWVLVGRVPLLLSALCSSSYCHGPVGEQQPAQGHHLCFSSVLIQKQSQDQPQWAWSCVCFWLLCLVGSACGTRSSMIHNGVLPWKKQHVNYWVAQEQAVIHLHTEIFWGYCKF